MTRFANENERAEHVSALNAAYDALQEGRYQDALQMFGSLAAEGSVTAWINLGWIYQSGSGVERDLAKAQSCYERAIHAGSQLAEHYLASIYRQKGDFIKALRHYENAARAGYFPAAYWAGSMFMNGEGVQPDPQQALRYLTEAAARGHVYARRDLALGNIRGAFGHRKVVRGILDWLRAITDGLVLAYRDPRNERLI